MYDSALVSHVLSRTPEPAHLITVATRFAPSPTGRLHIGNLRAAVVNWLFARQHGGRFLLRLDDTDAARSTEAFADSIRHDLAWAGLAPDAEVRQSERAALYDAALARLVAAGRAYPAYDTPDELDLKRRLQRAAGKPPVYDRSALALTDADRAHLEAQGRRPHWRFRLETAAPVEWTDLVRGATHIDPASLSDPIVKREDGGWLYMLPSVVDDIDLGITHVIRGEDHVPNSAVQAQMFAALGASIPAFAHLSLLTSTEGELSKRLGSAGVDALKAANIEPVALLAFLARLGTSQPIEPFADAAPLIEAFDLAHMGRATARFDMNELVHLNARTVHLLGHEAVADRLPPAIGPALWTLLRGNLKTIAEAADWADILTGQIAPPAMPEDAAYLGEALAHLPPTPWDAATWSGWTAALKTATGRKGRALFHPLRLALTGRETGPEMAALLPPIGRERSQARLAAASMAPAA